MKKDVKVFFYMGDTHQKGKLRMKLYCLPPSNASLHEFERRAQTVETLHSVATHNEVYKYQQGVTSYRGLFYIFYTQFCECYASLKFQVCTSHWEYWLKGEVLTAIMTPLYERLSSDSISLGLWHYNLHEYQKAIYHLEYGLTSEHVSKDCVLSRIVAVMALYAIRKETESREHPFEKALTETMSDLLGKLNMNSICGCRCPDDIESVFQSFLREVLQEEYDEMLYSSVLKLPECCVGDNETYTFPLCKLLTSGTRIKHLHIDLSPGDLADDYKRVVLANSVLSACAVGAPLPQHLLVYIIGMVILICCWD